MGVLSVRVDLVEANETLGSEKGNLLEMIVVWLGITERELVRLLGCEA